MDLSAGQIGGRIKHLRKEKGWTLKDLSGHAQVSTATLSKIENAQVAATFDTLVKIAAGLDVSFENILKDMAPSRVGGRLVVTGAGDALRFATSMYEYEVHSVELRRKRMIPLIMKIKARSLNDIKNWSSHAGEEFIYVIKGTVALYTEFYSPLELKMRESAYIDSEMEHAFVNAGEEDAEIISICLSSESTQDFFAAAGMREMRDPSKTSPSSD
ncbi:MAG TPA: XRE family transcriptional regulator [Acidisoma sp.]|uniref:helix-turn-helix domain-containing protein n=1 Tax=Acidisoma sp. TaxID=1872115 RepID=UPI002C39F111|nr:XRE family transcriptional regulator [Acidisoma sp.]HTI00713.1 XRE family transcriptional regulator [Acidisoma sp.]